MKMKKHFFSFFKSPIGVLLLIGLVVRVILFFAYKPYNHIGEVIYSDAVSYHQIALNIVENCSFASPIYFYDTLRTPIYPLFLAFFYSIFGVKIGLIILFQLLLSLGSVFLLYKIGEILFNKKVAILSAGILCFEPSHIYFSFDFLTDTLFVFLLLLGFLFLVKFITKNRLKFLVFSSFIFGIATLTRPILIFFPIVEIFVVAIHTFRIKENLSDIVKKSLIIVMIFSLTLLPWFIRNKVVYNSFSLSAISGYNLLNYNATFTIKRSSRKTIAEIRENLYDEVLRKSDIVKIANNMFYLSEIQKKVALNILVNHKIDFLKATIIGNINLYTSMGYKIFLYRFCRLSDYTTGQPGRFDKICYSWSRFASLPFLFILFGLLNLGYNFCVYAFCLAGLLIFIKKNGLLFYFFCL